MYSTPDNPRLRFWGRDDGSWFYYPSFDPVGPAMAIVLSKILAESQATDEAVS